VTHQFQVIFQGTSGTPKDRYVNTWHFQHSDLVPPPTDFDNVKDLLKDFYITAPTGNAIRTTLSGKMSLTVNVTAYDLDDEKPRAPVYQGSFTSPGFAGAAPLPPEVAICLSFEAKRVSGERQARRRNRVYLGPWATSAMSTDGQVNPSVQTDIFNAAKRLNDAAAAAVSWDWVVYSGLDQDWMAVQHIWVDNAFDIQRRRGLTPTNRAQIYY